MKKARAIVLRTAGTNCDAETVYALQCVGADVELVHMNELFYKRKSLKAYAFLIIPGGFSYGDDIASGKIFANQLIYRLGNEINAFVKAGKLILGICNGFQVLVKSGLLPGNDTYSFKQTVTLTYNDSDRFEDRWIYLKRAASPCIFTRDIPEKIFLPIAHAEGKFMYADKKIGDTLTHNKQIVFQYINADGHSTGYPHNPNGSMNDIAAVCNPQGTILGMMPHPERCISRYQHPQWTRKQVPAKGIGLQIFRNGIKYIKENF